MNRRRVNEGGYGNDVPDWYAELTATFDTDRYRGVIDEVCLRMYDHEATLVVDGDTFHVSCPIRQVPRDRVLGDADRIFDPIIHFIGGEVDGAEFSDVTVFKSPAVGGTHDWHPARGGRVG